MGNWLICRENTRIEPDYDLTIKSLWTLRANYGVCGCALILGVSTHTVEGWTIHQRGIARHTRQLIQIVSRLHPVQLARVTAPSAEARYKDRTKRKKAKPQPVVPAAPVIDDYSI